MYNWLVIVPPLLVVICALLTRRMILSFFVGIVSASLIATSGKWYAALRLALARTAESAGLNKLSSLQDIWNNWSLCIFSFLICLGILLILLQHSGGAQAFQQIAQRKVKNKRSTEVASLLLSLFFFIDDYFSALTVGSVMRPLAYLHKVHPVKLAFLVTAMAQPITILSPLTSWVGEIVLQLKQVGVSSPGTETIIAADPYYVFLRAIPFIFYAILLIVGTWYIVLRRISYGPMAHYEQQHTFNEEDAALIKDGKSASIIDFIIPLALLIGSVFIMLLLTGNFYLFGGTHGLLESLKNSSVHQALLVGGLSSVFISLIFFLIRGKIMPNAVAHLFYQGTALMLPSIAMLISAWTLSLLLKQDLQTGAYVATLFSHFVSILFFPLMCFVGSACIAWMIGSAWATMGLMFPIIVPMLKTLLDLQANAPLESVPLMLPVLGATLSGCIMGTHLSLISDNPIMASASTGANHFDLVKAMSWYIAPVALASAVAYTVLGLSSQSHPTQAHIGALIAGIVVTILLLELAQRSFGSAQLPEKNK